MIISRKIQLELCWFIWMCHMVLFLFSDQKSGFLSLNLKFSFITLAAVQRHLFVPVQFNSVPVCVKCIPGVFWVAEEVPVPDWVEMGGFLYVQLQSLIFSDRKGKHRQLSEQTHSKEKLQHVLKTICYMWRDSSEKHQEYLPSLTPENATSVWHHEVPLITHPRNRPALCSSWSLWITKKLPVL